VTDDADPYPPQPRSQLFTLRLWRDTGQSSERMPFMQVKHVLSGETRSFSTWEPLIAYLLSKMDALHHPLDNS
jgi:hypothetical protein